MTNPLGRSFLSYKRDRSEEAELLIAAQHDLGIPTWRDVDDLGGVPTEDQITAVLRDPETANAILWLTPEVASSLMVRDVEAPEILKIPSAEETEEAKRQVLAARFRELLLVPGAANTDTYRTAGTLH